MWEAVTWHRTIHGLRVPGASRCWARSRAARPRCLKRSSPRTGAIQRQGTVEAGTTVGDASKEARHHRMSVELSVATTTFMGDSYTFIDCPGSVEFIHDMRAVLPSVDAAVVVCEADEKKVPQLQLILRELEDLKIPALPVPQQDRQGRQAHPRHGELPAAGFARAAALAADPDLVGRHHHRICRSRARAGLCLQGARPSEIIDLKGDELDREKDARFTMLETLADHDDELMEQLLEDIPPPRDKIFDDLAKELREGLVCPVLLGAATPHQRRAAAVEGAAARGAGGRKARSSGSASRPATMRSPT